MTRIKRNQVLGLPRCRGSQPVYNSRICASFFFFSFFFFPFENLLMRAIIFLSAQEWDQRNKEKLIYWRKTCNASSSQKAQCSAGTICRITAVLSKAALCLTNTGCVCSCLLVCAWNIALASLASEDTTFRWNAEEIFHYWMRMNVFSDLYRPTDVSMQRSYNIVAAASVFKPLHVV